MQRNLYNHILSKQDAERIHNNALRILEEVGADIYNDSAMKILLSAGAKKTGDRRVSIPAKLIDSALKSAPNRIDVYDRNGNLKMVLEGHNSYFGMGPTCPYVIDLDTHERRIFKRQDCISGTILSDALENIDYIMSMGTLSDTSPAEFFEVDAFYCMTSNTDKPLMISAVAEKDLSIIYDVSCMIKGSEDEFRKKPFYIQYCEPTTPLKHSDTALQKLMFCSQKHIPLVYTPCPSAGGTAPVTLAGTLSVGTAEVLTGLVLNQLISKGAPFIYGGVFAILDMKTMNYSYASPEFLLFVGALADMAHYYNIPSFTTGGCSDSKSFDAQAAGEYAMSLLVSYMSGSNVIHDVGYIESGMTDTYEGIVYGNEIIGMIKRIDRGIRVDDETLAFDAIKETGVGGMFLSHEHTLKHFRTEHWTPKILDRSVYSQWTDNGKKNLTTVLNERAKEIIRTHKGHRLDSGLDDSIRKYLSKYYRI